MRRIFDPKLYLVIGPDNCRHQSMEDVVHEAIQGGVTLVQYRNKLDDDDIQIEHVKSLLAITKPKKIPLIVNDNISVAIASSADGIHLGQSDTDIKSARKLLGKKAIIGLTVKNENHIKSAPIEELDYLGIGGVFPTESKVNPDTPLGLDGLAALVALARKNSNIPLTAIAGIDIHNCEDVMKCGVNGIALVSAICAAPSPRTAAAMFHKKINQILAKRKPHG